MLKSERRPHWQPLFSMDPITAALDERFRIVDGRSRQLLGLIDDEILYRRPRDIDVSMVPFSCGEYLLRSAAMVEKACGGLTTRLWDDPFEWTLPEKLSTVASVIAYLGEVEETRQGAFRFIRSDADLTKTLPAPERMRSIAEILLESVGSAEHYQGRAFALFQSMFDAKLPRI
jgi:hypothetical protein